VDGLSTDADDRARYEEELVERLAALLVAAYRRTVTPVQDQAAPEMPRRQAG
jgi:hypothetical protein